MTLTDILRTLARFRRLAILVAIVTLAIGVYSAVSPPDRYRSRSTILVQPTLARGQGVSVQVIDFLVPSVIKTSETRNFRDSASRRVPAALRSADVEIRAVSTPSTGILTVTASSTDRRAVAPWANAVAAELVETTKSDFVDLVLIDEAVEPGSPFAPSRGTILLVSAFLALAFALVAAALASAIRGRGDSASELRERFGAAVLGEIPKVRRSIADLSPADLFVHDRTARVAEALQTLRANVSFALAGRPNPWLVVTSADQGEGKSFVALSLSWLLASVNRSTILIEGDSRRPNLYRRLGVPVGVGLEGVGPHDLRHALQATSNPLLRFLGPGRPDRHPAEIASTHLPHVLRQAAAWGDVVIIDSPPLPVTAETIVYATATQNVLLVIDSRRRDLTNVERVITALQDRDVHILGVVINRSKRKIRGGSYYAATNPADVGIANPPRPADRLAAPAPSIRDGAPSTPARPFPSTGTSGERS